MDTIKVEALVQEFLAAQSLKILPQAPFGDAVNQFVSKDDKHAMEQFVTDSLAGQVKDLLALDDDEDEDLESHMERYRAKLEAQFVAGQLKIAQRRRIKPRPDLWDSDLDGHWEDQPEAIDNEPEPESAPKSSRGRGKAAKRTILEDDDDDDVVMDDAEDEPPVRKAPAKRGAAARTTKAAPAKKAPVAAKKAPARGGRRKAGNPFIDDDDEDEDMFVSQDEEEPNPAPSARAPPKRAQPARASTRTTKATKQTKLDFSQSQRPAAKASQKALEISDDEISEDDAFESMPATRARRR